MTYWTGEAIAEQSWRKPSTNAVMVWTPTPTLTPKIRCFAQTLLLFFTIFKCSQSFPQSFLLQVWLCNSPATLAVYHGRDRCSWCQPWRSSHFCGWGSSTTLNDWLYLILITFKNQLSSRRQIYRLGRREQALWRKFGAAALLILGFPKLT